MKVGLASVGMCGQVVAKAVTDGLAHLFNEHLGQSALVVNIFDVDGVGDESFAILP